jgi:hypothetical protein
VTWSAVCAAAVVAVGLAVLGNLLMQAIVPVQVEVSNEASTRPTWRALCDGRGKYCSIEKE